MKAKIISSLEYQVKSGIFLENSKIADFLRFSFKTLMELVVVHFSNKRIYLLGVLERNEEFN